ncbi:MAG: RnfABCDGE type electron transport complex subunit G [Lachnospiraceae bacterium]|nr:RnfABCDGE type electron transport complex subunit G [Lachnospiraceae bacterium]
MNEMTKNTLIMTAFALTFGLLLGLVHAVTAGPIAAQHERQKNEAYSAVLEAASDFSENMEIDQAVHDAIEQDSNYNASITSVINAKDDSGSTVGYVIDVSSHGGYGGDINFSIGIGSDGSVEGISITKIAETPGLGMKAQSDPAFCEQFIGGDSSELKLSSEGGEINGITSATFTSRCMVRGVNAGLKYYQDVING